MAFHEVRFPTAIARGSRGGPERRTDIVTLASGHEQRNQRWADSRRRYNAGWGIKSLADLAAVVAFFEERRGRLHGFRWKDHADWSSAAAPDAAVSATDQAIGTGDGGTTGFQLVKTYGGAFAPWTRDIVKPVAGTVVVAVDGALQAAGVDYTLDETTGIVTFAAPPAGGAVVTAGFAFDVPVRFDTDRLDVDPTHFGAGTIADIPVVEIRP